MDKRKELIVKILILIILLVLVFITSFKTGTKFYLLKYTILEETKESVESSVARWNFNAKIIEEDEVLTNEEN